MSHGKEKPLLQFPLFRRQYHIFGALNAFSDPMSSSSAIAKAVSNTDGPSPTVETQEVDLTRHYPQNPPTPPHGSTSSSSGGPTIVTQGGSSVSSNATSADDGQIQGMPCSSSSVQTVSVLREGKGDIITKSAELIVEASIMCCDQIDSSKFMRTRLEQLLPRDIKKTMQLKLFSTARHEDVRKRCRIKTHAFVIRCLPSTEMSLSKIEMYEKTNGTKEQMNSSPIEQNIRDMRWNSKTFHCANNSHLFRKKQTKRFSYSDGREREMKCYLFIHHFLETVKDPFLDICSFVQESKLGHSKNQRHLVER